MASIISTIFSILVIAGMYTGIYNPCAAPFTPPEVTFPAYEGETVTLIEGGASDYVIVVGQDAIPAEITAAQKLQGFLKDIGGAELPIVLDSAAPQATEIAVGDTNRCAVDFGPLGEEGFVLRTQGERIIIAGGKTRGTLYAVYDFLEKFLGCHWYSKDRKVIPVLAKVQVPAEIDETEIPAFAYRQFTTVQGGFDVDSALANRVNAGAPMLNAPEYGGVSRYVLDGHAGEQIMSEVIDGVTYTMSSPEYFERHKDLFAKDKNGNPVGGYSNPCFSNPGVLEIYVAYVRKRMAADPNTACISIALNDTDNTCQCLACRTVYLEECGIPLAAADNRNCSGTHFRFLNALCAELAPEYPDLIINTYAYYNTELAPKTRLHPNALVSFCPIFMCYVHKNGECAQEGTRKTFDVNYKTWVEKVDNLVIYEYPLSYNHWPAVYPVWDNIQSYLRMYRDDGVLGLTNCSSSQDTAFHQLIGYIYAKLLWNPDTDMEEIYSSFLPQYYGAGWQYVREYIRVVSEELSGQTIAGAQQHSDCLGGGTATGNLLCTDNQLQYVDALWAKAKELTAASADPQKEAQLRGVRMAELSWRVWKGDSFRGEFWPLQLPLFVRQKSNTDLFYDIKELGLVMHDEDSKYVSEEDFEKLDLQLLSPRYWCWRAIGRENEGKLENIWQVIWSIIW